METMEAPVKRTDKQERYRENRKQLIELSNMLRGNMPDDMGMNEALKDYYAEEGHEELNTYRQWLELGHQVRRGERALLLWGAPRKKVQTTAEDEDAKYKFWPLAYVFSNLQLTDEDE